MDSLSSEPTPGRFKPKASTTDYGDTYIYGPLRLIVVTFLLPWLFCQPFSRLYRRFFYRSAFLGYSI